MDVELRALVEDAKSVGTRSSTDEVGQDTGIDILCVTSIRGFIAAGQLSLIAALRLCLLDGHPVGYVPADGIVVLASEAVRTAGNSVLVRCGSSQS